MHMFLDSHTQNKYSTTDSEHDIHTFVKVVFPLVMCTGTVEIVGKVTSHCYCEYERRTDPERSCLHSTGNSKNANIIYHMRYYYFRFFSTGPFSRVKFLRSCWVPSLTNGVRFVRGQMPKQQFKSSER